MAYEEIQVACKFVLYLINFQNFINIFPLVIQYIAPLPSYINTLIIPFPFQVLGLYGLIVAIYLYTKTSSS